MGKIAIQFHALPKELLPLVKPFVDEFGLHVVAMRFFPFEAIEVNPSELAEIFAEESPYRELAFTLRPPILPVTGNLDFADKHPDKLRLDIQRKTERGLRQTFLHACTNDQAALSVWKIFANRLRKMTKAGVIVVNPDTGIAGKYKAFTYSAGAKALASTGIPMFPVAGDNLVEFPEAPTTEVKRA